MTPTNGSRRPKSVVNVTMPLGLNSERMCALTPVRRFCAACEQRQIKLPALCSSWERNPRRTMPVIHLVRHAQPDFHGNYDSLTELGYEQCRWLGEHYAA